MLIYIYLAFALFYDSSSRLYDQLNDIAHQPYSNRNIFWWIVIICFALYWYYSPEWREKGFVYRGKTIPFTDVARAQWDGHWTKTKLKIKLTNKEQELMFTVPPEMAPVIDNYLQSNFPRP